MDVKAHTTRLVSEIDPVELGVLILESVAGITRLAGLTALQAFETIRSEDQVRVIDAARKAMTYVTNCVNVGSTEVSSTPVPHG